MIGFENMIIEAEQSVKKLMLRRYYRSILSRAYKGQCAHLFLV
jgi:hypothetical protein